jgi:hypothetical protein
MSDLHTEYCNHIRQTASEQLEALAPYGHPFDRKAAEAYIREEWEITAEQALYGIEDYITDILDSVQEYHTRAQG